MPILVVRDQLPGTGPENPPDRLSQTPVPSFLHGL
jgi:hypothetical protein